MEDQITRVGPHIVVGVDGSPESVLALKWAQTLAGVLEATITAVTAWHFETAFGPYSASEWDPESDTQQVLDTALTQAFGDQFPSGLRAQAIRGRPAQVLIDEAKSAKMLIVGSRGHGGFAGMLLGSVSSACAEHASCPVLVVHGADDGAEVAAVGASHEDADEPVRKN
ncbi:universal stress protein [Arthrobacter sp. LAPM80]|uniref:universal stress protein n=1 Tax=Arthrobacter sp. LAPM80 TaxID=3141788 RepID=UPI00398AFB97